VVREKSGKMNYYNYSVAAIIVQTEICNTVQFIFDVTFPAKVNHIYNNSLLGLHNTMDELHLFISLLFRGSIISKCSLKMSGKVHFHDLDWRVATLVK